MILVTGCGWSLRSLSTRGVRIIPVLVDGATMPPPASELPPALRELTRRQAVTLSPEHP